MNCLSLHSNSAQARRLTERGHLVTFRVQVQERELDNVLWPGVVEPVWGTGLVTWHTQEILFPVR